MCIRDSPYSITVEREQIGAFEEDPPLHYLPRRLGYEPENCLLYTSDAADDLLCVDLGGRRIIKKKKQTNRSPKHNAHTQQ